MPKCAQVQSRSTNCSPVPSSTSEIVSCISSMKAAPAGNCRGGGNAAAGNTTSRPPAAALACAPALSIPSVTNRNSRAAGHRERRPRVVREHEHRRVVRRLLAPHQPRQRCRRARGPRTGPNMLRPRIHAPMPSNAREATSSSTPVSLRLAEPCMASATCASGRTNRTSPQARRRRADAPRRSDEDRRRSRRVSEKSSEADEEARHTSGSVPRRLVQKSIHDVPKRSRSAREALREKRFFHLHEDLAAVGQQLVNPLRLRDAVDDQREIRAAHRLEAIRPGMSAPISTLSPRSRRA